MRIEIRGNQVLLDGYVNACGRDSRVLPSPNGKFIEQIPPKVFQRALENAENIELLFNHKRDRKLGSTKEGNLELFEDNIGLRAICTVTDEEVVEKAKDGKLKGWSFGFYSIKDRWEEASEGLQRRYLDELELIEVSILDKTPAYIATSIEARGEEDVISEVRNEEFIAKSEIIEERSLIDYSSYEQTIKTLRGE